MTGPAKLHVVTVVGARPQFIKAATVSRAFGASNNVRETIVHTGQHFDANMSDVFFSDLQIPAPAYNFDIHGLGHGAMTGRMLEEIEGVLVKEKPDAVLVYGDTNSTAAGALAAVKLHIPVAHVEAGLRSFNRRMPEEINRIVADHVSTMLFCPTTEAVKNLRTEGITDNVHHVGDVMFDATLHARASALDRSDILEALGLTPGAYGVCTVHRAENTDDEDRFRRVMAFIEDAAKDSTIVFPVHPRTRAILDRLSIAPANVTLVDPLGYFDLHRLLADATLVLTDSGGLQKEAYFHRVPCITLRDETEWVETVAAGWNRLWTSPDYAVRQDISEYGDGQAAERIVALLCETCQ